MAVAETQLYAKVSNKHRSKSPSALLESLLARGFPAHIAQKALVATGQKSVEDAAKWLHSHCNDPSLDDPIPQEYALYLCPTGHLHNCLQEFWKESKRQCGKNRAHEIFPHITLCDFFTCEDQKVELLYDILKQICNSFAQRFPPTISLSLHSSTSYLGFFVGDSHANILKEFAVAFSSEASALADCHVKPCLKQLHLTLAHKFCPHHQKTLEQLAKCINPGETCHWVAALYSRDMRFVHYQLSQNTNLRRGVLVMRHGERVDQVFGKSWLQQCLTADGKYYRADLNFPSTLPKRKDSVKHFEHDPPLSSCGVFQSRLTGEALLDQEVTVSYVYSSPALRCIQTAQHVLQGLKLDQKVKIRVEPGLFEWTKWEASRVIPNFMTLAELTEASYNIDTSYRGNIPLSSLVPSESYEEYVSRSSAAIKEIVTACPNKGVILIVGHGSSLASFTRPLVGLPARESSDFAQVVRKIPSLGMCFCEELKEEKKWLMVNPPVKTLTHGANAAFNWRNSIMED
ncbi:ubiquitin-associated and SH3 domain-containing protein A isoform X2 [Numida meleagris]|uniref:ubiquitin-associated and SH3 domain-containing protein A isoform X2 n=1 Tax=Numida meleagris TaxID=8996 RepID=UPI000B3E184C|nr:ubiquitin-associated and SH3 domain-containing protein A isoform X2 [Numida meleagris]